MSKGSSRKLPYGTWTPESGIRARGHRPMWHPSRRGNLTGVTLSVQTSPFTVVSPAAHSGRRPSVARQASLHQELFLAFRAVLGFGFRQAVNRRFSGRLVNRTTGAFDGQVGALQRGEADYVVGPLDVTLERSAAVGFTIPVHTLKRGLCYLPRERRNIDAWAFLDVVAVPARLAFAAALALTVVAFAAASKRPPGASLAESVGRVGILNLQLDYQEEGRVAASGRALKTVAALSAFLFFAHYHSVLTSLMTSGPPEPRIQSFEVNLLQQKRHDHESN